MRRHLQRLLTLQTAALADDGLQVKPTWTGGTPVSVTLTPATKSDVEKAGLRGERVTHMALVPFGVAVKTTVHRFLDGSTVYRVVDVVQTPKFVVCGLEATT